MLAVVLCVIYRRERRLLSSRRGALIESYLAFVGYPQPGFFVFENCLLTEAS